MKDHPRNGSSLAPEELPPWYYTLESVLGDTNTKLAKMGFQTQMIRRMVNCILIVVKRSSLSRQNMCQTITRKTRLKVIKN